MFRDERRVRQRPSHPSREHPSVFDELSPEEIALLKELADKGSPVSEARLDADALRSLGLRRYIKRLSGFSIITPDGRRALQSLARGGTPAPAARQRDHGPYVPTPAPVEEAAPAAEGDGTTVNSTQEDMLRQLAQAESPVPFDDLDGRVVRALEGRGLVRRAAGVLEVTEAGREFYDRHVRRRRRARSGWLRVGSEGSSAPPPADAAEERRRRADELRRAIAALEQALSGETMIDVGGEEKASVAEALVGLRELAERVERGEDPRRITRRRPD
jgi:DNA-binding MarR family transcriptional regulator